MGLIETLTPEITAMAGGANADADVGTGGMATKLEAARIARSAGCATLIVSGLVSREWTSSEIDDTGEPVTCEPRPLAAADVIVVTPYNAQQVLIEEALAGAGFAEVRVGTVDRFQGQEAVVAIVSLAASSGREAPRGLEFLLLRNRLNVGLSRAMQAAYLVYSPGVLDDLPRTPEGVARLSGFARLVRAVPA